MMLGLEDIVIALSATVSWALAVIINKSLSSSVGSLHMNTVRLWSGFAIVLASAWVLGKYGSISAYSTIDLIFLVSSGVVALALGDTVFIRSLYFIYVSQAY